jgi:ketosteroid isomerase-like protein
MPANSPQACTTDFTAALIGRDMETALTLLTDDVVFFYSNGSAIVGKDAFSSLMTTSWKMVEDYVYSTADPVWIAQSDSAASVVYSFTWTGKVRDQAVGGGGRTTRVLRNDGLGWRIAHEHLSNGDWKP